MTRLTTSLCTAALCAFGVSHAFAGDNLCGTEAEQCSSPGTCLTYGWTSNGHTASNPNPQNLGNTYYTQCTTDCTVNSVTLYTNITAAQADARQVSLKAACNDHSAGLGHID
jgi:hypothetical protein